jgi:hypothetical protein
MATSAIGTNTPKSYNSNLRAIAGLNLMMGRTQTTVNSRELGDQIWLGGKKQKKPAPGSGRMEIEIIRDFYWFAGRTRGFLASQAL